MVLIRSQSDISTIQWKAENMSFNSEINSPGSRLTGAVCPVFYRPYLVNSCPVSQPIRHAGLAVVIAGLWVAHLSVPR